MMSENQKFKYSKEVVYASAIAAIGFVCYYTINRIKKSKDSSLVPQISQTNFDLLKSQSIVDSNRLYKQPTDDIANYIIAINFLIEILPIECLRILFNDYIGFDCSPYIQVKYTHYIRFARVNLNKNYLYHTIYNIY